MAPRDAIPLAVLHSRGFGQDHYWIHLWERFAAFARPEYLTVPGRGGDRVTVRQLTPYREILDTDDPSNVERVAAHCRASGVRIVLPQVATDFCRHRVWFGRLLDRLREDGVGVVATVHNVLPHDRSAVPHEELVALYDRFDAFVVGNQDQRALLEARFDPRGRPVVVAPQV